MFKDKSGGGGVKGGSRMGRKEDQSSCRRSDLYLEWRHFQKAAMFLVRRNQIDFYFKSINCLLVKVGLTRNEAGDTQGFFGPLKELVGAFFALS